ncbi:MAG: amidohydrolase [Cellulophaga sp.]
MKKLFFLLGIVIVSCNTNKEQVDLIVVNANAYTIDVNFSKAEAFAIKDGKFVAVGTSEQIKSSYLSDITIDAEGKTITPGLIDAHCHFYNLGLQEQKVDLSGTISFEEVLERIVSFQKEKNVGYITGRGWDQNDWEVKEFPTKEKLDKLFPDTPVAVTRIDGHALLANQAAIDLAEVTVNTTFSGGEILQKEGKLTGVFIDVPMELILSKVPKPTKTESIQALKDAEKISFSYGLTTVDDAGLSRETIELIDSLQQVGELQIRLYAMLSNYPENVDYFLKKGIIKTDKLNVRSVKVYGDGALGSRGATLRESYSDKKNHFGAMVTPVDAIEKLAIKIADSDYQMNTHAIGDSANIVVLKAYKKALKGNVNRRWRVEHAQVIPQAGFDYFKEGVIPSVQPTHATSDMYWAGDRLGEKRMKGAYAYKELLNMAGMIALGTDYPVEQVSPFLTFYAAVSRMDMDNYPEGGFQMHSALSREETLKGMTIWAAYANFEENEKGSIEVGKFADFIVLDKNIMEIDVQEIPSIKVEQVFLGGARAN